MISETPPEQSAEGWSGVADDYDAAFRPFTTLYATAALDRAAPGAGERVLDVAAGSGALALLAAAAGNAVTAVDFAPAMVERLVANARAAGLSSLIDARVMDGQALALPDAVFDVAFSIFGLIFFPQPERGLREIRRVLRSEGRFALAVWTSPDRHGPIQVFAQAIRVALPDMPMPEPAAWWRFGDEAYLRTILRQTGFEPFSVEKVARDWQVPSAEWLATHGFASPVATAMRERLGVHGTEAVRQTMIAQLRGQYGDGPFALSAEALIAVGKAD